MTMVNTDTGEITEAMTQTDARRLTDRIQLIAEALADNLDKLADLIDQARTGSAWLVLGYRSWTDYVSQEFIGVLPRLEREPRQEFVRELASRGMSTRAIAPIVGTNNATVHRDLAAVADSTPEPPQVEEVAPSPSSSVRGVEPTPQAAPTAQAPRPAVVGIDGKTYTRPAPKPAPTGDEAEYANAEQACLGLTRALSRLLTFQHTNMRAGMRRYWGLASREVPPTQRQDVTAEQMRTAAQSLLQLAEEWEFSDE